MAAHPEGPSATPENNRPDNLLDRLWYFLGSSTSAGVFLSLTAIVVLLSAVIPQLPSDLSDPLAQSRWMAERISEWGVFGSALGSLGLFQMQDSLLWKVVLGFDLLAVLVMLEAAIRRAWLVSRGAVEALVLPLVESNSTNESASDVLSRASQFLSAKGLSVQRGVRGSASELKVRLRPWAAWLKVGAYTGIGLVLVALMLSPLTSRSEQIALGSGESAPLTLHSGWTLHLEQFVAGEGSSSSGDAALFGPEADLIREGRIGAQAPLVAGGISFHLADSGPGLAISATDAAGQPLQLQAAGGAADSSLFLRFDETQPEQYFAVLDIGDTVRVVLHPAAQASHPQFLVQVYRGTGVQPLSETLVAGSQLVTVDGVTYEFAPQAYAQIIAVQNPAQWLLWIGGALALCALALSLVFPHGVALLQVQEVNGETHLRLRSAGRRTTALGSSARRSLEENGDSQ